MENLSNSDENYDLGYQLSPSSVDQINQSIPETLGYSTFSGGSFVYDRTFSGRSAFSEPVDDRSCFSEASPFHWAATRGGAQNQAVLSRLGTKKLENNADEKQLEYLESLELELETTRERFAKLLLGEDMSGNGRGVCSAVTISNAITNLYATVFGQNLRLEPLNPEKKAMWKREMNCHISICDYIVEFTTKSQNLRDGRAIEVMESRPRPDIYVNLPALRKLDAMLIEILDSFEDREFWYAEEGNLSLNSSRTGSFRRVVKRDDEKWWVPMPRVPPFGLPEKARKHLRHKRDCANQIHKAAMAINTGVLAEMEIPDSYVESLPKSGRDSIGDQISRSMHAPEEKFSPDYLLDSLSIASEHEALELADRVEASMYTWRRKACIKHSKSSWGKVKELMSDVDGSDKNHVMAERAKSLLFALKQRYPELSQTTLDTCKIQHNRDVGQATLESYSRVLEGLAFNIVAWIEDVFFVDTTIKSKK
ncbi:Rop guanine nucleotide exchange factor 2 [Hibiscus syriacus]|uniref:Rop guanine nucleotide exchange factor 2 n=1 Tax=Hibiscus syriacus TaxID=106335 RepID=A0A6A2WVT9_HIBSY|nr:rop guanine nucleotide exchange factor 3-like [Hibiscus syriacus]KAE8665812.1 Rop guanine nucleotide exchange factor 2 [Hibiscus syriacus]